MYTIHRIKTTAFSVATLVFVAAQAFAVDDRDTIARIKPSIVAVGTFVPMRNPQFEFRGTGFAVADGSLIATNHHVIPSILDPERNESLAVAISDGKKLSYSLRQRAQFSKSGFNKRWRIRSALVGKKERVCEALQRIVNLMRHRVCPSD